MKRLCAAAEKERERERQSVVATMSRGQLAFGLAWHVLPRTGLAWTGLDWSGRGSARGAGFKPDDDNF